MAIGNIVDGINAENEGRVIPFDRAENFKDTIRSFISKQTSEVNEKDALEVALEKKIMETLEMGEVDMAELRRLKKDISESKNDRLRIMFNILAPSPNNTNPLIPNNKREDEMGEMFENITPKQLQAVNKLYILMQKLDSSEVDKETE